MPITGDNASPINSLTREIVTRMLAGYLELEKRLQFPSVDRDKVFLLVIEEVLVPTMAEAVVGNLTNFEDPIWQRPWMIGDEFRGDRFWYLPAVEKEELSSPLQRTLKYWLRAGGFNLGYGFGRHISRESPANPKKQMERWLNGSVKPMLTDLHTYVDRAGEVDWLGGTADWKARFTLAWAIQTAGEELERTFRDRIQKPALHFAEVYRGSARYALRYESYGPVSFVARLVENEFRKRNLFQSWLWVRKLRQHLSNSWKGPPPLEEVLETMAVRHWLLSRARKEGVIGPQCVSLLFPDPSEQPTANAQWFYDLALPLKQAMSPETFKIFCDFAITIGVELINRRLAGLRGGERSTPLAPEC